MLGETNEPHQLRECFDEFKFHLLYRNKSRGVGGACEQFKNLLSQVKRETRLKRERRRGLQEMKGMREQQQSQRNDTLHSKIWRPAAIDLSNLERVSQEIMVIEKERENLEGEINELQGSTGELNKQVRGMRKTLELQSVRQQKFKHISYLTNSIQRSTESTKTGNYRSFRKMIGYQEETLAGMRRFKISLKKENDDLETRLQRQSKTAVGVARKECLPKTQGVVQEGGVRVDRLFMSRLQELVDLFINRQAEFEQMKSEQTTKVRLKKVLRCYLKEDRAKFQEMVDRFEQKYDVKIESLANLILHVYQRLNIDNGDMQNRCIKKNQLKVSLIEDLDDLSFKQRLMVLESVQTKDEEESEESEGKRRKIAMNSGMLVNFISLLHNLMGKFKYLFSTAVTLNMSKKNFQQVLIQIGSVYKPDSIFYQKQRQCTLDSSYEQTTNFKEMRGVLQQHMSEKSMDGLEVLGFIFDDLRYSLMFRRGWLQDELREGVEGDRLLQKIEEIQKRCDEIYEGKIKIYTHLFISAIKVLCMNKYERKMIASCKTGGNLFFAPQLRHRNIDDPTNSDRSSEKQQAKDGSQRAEQSEAQMQFTHNPRKIVQMLQKLKNEQKATFRPMTFDSSQVYMYDGKVVLPKYACDHFLLDN